jgi:hypothetical protein
MEQTPATQDSESEAPMPPVMSLAGRMTSVIAAPSEAFEAVKNSPPCAANWVAPALLLILISWIGTAIIFSQPAVNQQIIDIGEQAMQKQFEKQNLPPEKAEQIRQMQEKFAPISAKIGAAVLPVFVGFLGPFIWGLFLWLIGAKAFKGGFTYMKAVEAVGLANVILALEAVVRTLLVLSVNNLYATPSLALLVMKAFDPQNTLHGLLGAVNVMTFWLLAARSIGLARLSNVSVAKAAACVFGIWLAYTGFFIGLGAAVKAIMSRVTGS